MFSFVICDDDVKFCETFRETLASVMNGRSVEYELKLFHSAPQLMEAIDRGEKFDLIFLDVMLGDDNGIDTGKAIRERRYPCDIIFISSHRDFAYDSFEVRPIHYLEKSPDFERLEAAIERFLEKSSVAMIHLTTPRGTLALNLADIVYFEVYGHELIIHKTDGVNLRHRSTLREMEALLPQTAFVRTQRSYLVNLAHVREISRREITMSNGDTVPIGRGLYDALRLKFLEYVAKKNELV